MVNTSKASSSSTTTQTQTQTENGSAGSVYLRGEADLINAHSAYQQQPAPLDHEGRRSDRLYPPAYEGENPEGWPTGEGMPDYRPIDYGRTLQERPWAATPPEIVFARTMLSGVLVIGYINAAWRKTGGRITKNFWTYPTGGYY